MKRQRSETLLVGLVLLCFVGGTLWLLQRTYSPPEQLYPPLTTLSAQPDGALALYELAASAGIHVQRHNDNEYHYPARGCVVLLEDPPSRQPMLGLDVTALRLWLEQGGTLIVAAADASEQSLVHGLLAELEIAETSVEFVAKISQPNTEAKFTSDGTKGQLTPLLRTQQSGQVYELPEAKPALFTGVNSIEHGSGAARTIEAVELLRSDVPLLYYRKIGAGQLYWLTRPEMAANAWLARADNHRLLLNVIETAAKGLAVHFDEHIHGFARETPNVLALLFRTRGGQLLLALMALTLLLFAGAAVRPAKFSVASVPERRQGTEMVLAQADLYQRADARHVIADCQLDSLKRTYMERTHQAFPPSDEQLKDWITGNWRGDTRQQQLLLNYLSSRLISRGGSALLELARAVDSAKAMLS